MSINKHVSLLSLKVDKSALQTQVIDTLCFVLVILGLIGNIIGLFIFSSSRQTWRISSTYVYLATSSSITNLLCVIRSAFILHVTSRNILHDLIGQKWWACKLYEISFSFRVIASWLTLFWMFERLMCVSRRLRTFFNRCNSFKFKFIIPIILIIIILGCVIGPPVYMYQPKILTNDTINSTINIMICDIDSNVSIKWQQYFHEVHFGLNHFTIRCLFSELTPTGAIILFNSYIIYHLARTYRRLHQTSDHIPRRKQSRTASWMNIVLILHSLLFLSSLFAHILGHFIVVEAHEAWWVILVVLINCSLNFYVYCLSGKAFRNEIRRLFQRLKTRFFNRSETHQQQSCQN